jgi:DNA-binding HxlR family transcriptional regulator
MRSYGQYCPLANGLDLVGDRWTLLIVRELGIRSARYADLHAALPGIATNLLAERLRALAAAGVVEVATTPPPAVATVYALTDWGRQLYDIVVRLGRWGARTLLAGPGDRSFRARYVIPVAHALYAIDADRSGLAPLTIAVEHGAERAHVTLTAGGVEGVIDTSGRPADVVLDGAPDVVYGLLAGVLDPRDHTDAVHGTPGAIRRLRAWTRRAVVSPAE